MIRKVTRRSTPRTGVFKRTPEIEPETRETFTKLSKAEWAEAFRDLFTQVFGEDAAADGAWAKDAARRAEILAGYRRAEKAQAR